MKRVRKEKKNKNLFRMGLASLLLTVLLLSGVLVFKKQERKKSDELKKESNKTLLEETKKDGENQSNWSIYANKDYSISFSYPYLLHSVEKEDAGEYELFLVFEENEYSKEKGVAFAVSKDGLQKEVERIKKDIAQQGGSELVKEEDVFVNDKKGKIIEYEPKESGLEKRSFFIFEKGDFTFSLSTTPQQIQRLIESVSFLN